MADGLLNKASIILTPTGYKAGTLYNVAPIDEPYEDFDFARASVASRVNSSGLVEMVGRTLGSELVVNGNWYSHRGAYFEITNDLIYIENDGNTYGGIEQSFSVSSGKNFQLKYTAIEGTTSTDWRVNIGSSQGGTDLYSKGQILDFTENTIITSTSSEIWIRIYNNTPTIGDNFSIDNVSVKEIIDTNNIPRISYDSNGDNGHILLEPTSTNLITYSEDFSDSSWNLDFAASYITRTPNAATSPSGENNATKLIANDTSRDPNNSYIGASTSASAPYSASIFAKKAEYDYLVLGIGSYGGGYYAIFNLSNGTISTSPTASGTTASIEDYGNGWYRCIITTTNTSGSEVLFTTPSVDGTLTTDYTNTTNGVYVWGAQLEELSYATSYIPTYGSTETRATETATGAGSADLINSTEGVLYAEIAALADGGDTRTITISSAANNRITLSLHSTTNRVQFYIAMNGYVNTVDLDATDISQTNMNKIACKFKANDYALWINGVEKDTNTTQSNTVQSGTLNSLNFDINGSNNFYGKVKAVAVFNEALSDSELTQLTT